MNFLVKKFGPIENVMFEYAPMVIFTGDSNLGKSYINYLLYYIMKCLTRDKTSEFMGQRKKNKDGDYVFTLEAFQKWMNSSVEDFMRVFLNNQTLICDVDFNLLPDAREHQILIHVDSENITMGVDGTSGIIQKSIKVTVNEETFNRVFPNISSIEDYVVSEALATYLQKKTLKRTLDQVLILPPARGAFVGENYTMKDRIASSVGMYRQFLEDYDNASQYRLFARRKKSGKFTERIENLIGGTLITEDNIQYLKLKSGYKLPLSAAASSIKELSPILFTLDQNGIFKRYFCIEEPEAHLHPRMQVAFIDLLASCFNEGNVFHFTTHSDYVIQRINQLIKLDYIRMHNREAFANICKEYKLSKEMCIHKEDVKVYYFSADEMEEHVDVQSLTITDKGIPMVTFFEVVKAMADVEADLNNAMEIELEE